MQEQVNIMMFEGNSSSLQYIYPTQIILLLFCGWRAELSGKPSEISDMLLSRDCVQSYINDSSVR